MCSLRKDLFLRSTLSELVPEKESNARAPQMPIAGHRFEIGDPANSRFSLEMGLDFDLYSLRRWNVPWVTCPLTTYAASSVFSPRI